MEHLKNGTLRNKRTIAILTNKYYLESKTIKDVSEELKQRIMATAKKIDRYDARIKQFRQNQQFSTNQTQTTSPICLTKVMSHNSEGIYGTPQKSTTTTHKTWTETKKDNNDNNNNI